MKAEGGRDLHSSAFSFHRLRVSTSVGIGAKSLHDTVEPAREPGQNILSLERPVG
jgi:hypothetical protein